MLQSRLPRTTSQELPMSKSLLAAAALAFALSACGPDHKPVAPAAAAVPAVAPAPSPAPTPVQATDARPQPGK
jgi:hypothetical protein